MKPYLRYVGVVLIALLLAFAFHNGAHGEERQPDPECVLALTPEVAGVVARHKAGVSPALNRYLIRSDPILTGQGRWVLLRVLDAIESDKEYPATTAFAALGYLCALPSIPTAAGTYRSEFDRPKDI